MCLLLGQIATGFLPAGNSGGKMLDVLVAKLFGGSGGTLVSVASWATAISDHQGIFVLWQKFRQILTVGAEVDSSGDVTLFIGFCPIDVNYCNLTGLYGALKVFNANVGIFSGENGGSEDS